MKRTLRWTALGHPAYTCPARCLSGLPLLPKGGVSTNVKVVLEGYHSRNTCWISFAVMKPLLQWWLDYGATIYDDGYEAKIIYPPLSESVAQHGIFGRFRWFRKQGASIGRRTLHLVMEIAIHNRPICGMEMVRYLADEVELNVHQLDAEMLIPHHWGPLMLYVSQERADSQDGNLMRFLLERGADLYLIPEWINRAPRLKAPRG